MKRAAATPATSNPPIGCIMLAALVDVDLAPVAVAVDEPELLVSTLATWTPPTLEELKQSVSLSSSAFELNVMSAHCSSGLAY